MTDPLLTPLLIQLVADAAVKSAVGRLRERRTLKRVADASAAKARRGNVHIDKGSLRLWLGRDDVQDELASGHVSENGAVVAQLRWLLVDAGDDRDRQARELFAIVVFELLAESDPARAVALGTNQVTAALARDGTQTRDLVAQQHEEVVERLDRTHDLAEALVDSLQDARGFFEDLRSLQPWRAEKAQELAELSPSVRRLVASIVQSRDRKRLFIAWSQRTPEVLEGASAEVWCWLGEVASDYQASASAVSIFRRGIEAGAQPSEYWFARAAMAAAQGDNETEAMALLVEGGGEHPLSRAIRADISRDHQSAAAEIIHWEPDSDADHALKAVLLASWRYATGSHNAAIELVTETARKYPQSSGLALRTAEMFAWRSHEPHNPRSTDDAQDALAWSIKARNAMRTWGGASWKAVKVAIATTGLLHDLERGYRLTQASPQGEASAAEAAHPYIRKQAALLAAMLGRFERAAELADAAGDTYTQATVEALIAIEAGDKQTARASWQRAYDASSDAMERMQTVHTMVGFGVGMPEGDLRDLESAFPEQFIELAGIVALPADPEERLLSLRARATDSARMTVELAGEHNARGEFGLAGRVLEEGAARWSDPLLAKMAADRFRRAGDHIASQRAAESALSLASGGWGGETETRMILFDALEAQGDYAGATREAGNLLRLDGANLDARWALIYCLLRQGDLVAAWNALTPAGEPVQPRNHDDARTWATLLSRFDTSDQYLRRMLIALERWIDHEEVRGTLITQAYIGLMRREDEPADADLAALHDATSEFTEAFPDSEFFRAIPIDPDDPLGFITQTLRRRHEGLAELVGMWMLGRLPTGLVADVSGNSLTEVALRRGPGPLHSHRPIHADQAASHVAHALEGEIVLDITAAATLAGFSPELTTSLIGRFSRTLTTDADLHDALAAKESLALKSNLTTVWDPNLGRVRAVTLDETEVARLKLHSSRVADFLSSSRVMRRPLTRLLQQLREQAPDPDDEQGLAENPDDERIDASGPQQLAADSRWMAALELAASTGAAIWCDDVALQGLADEFELPSFGTVDLIRHLMATGRMDADLGRVAQGVLVDAYHVDLGFDPKVMTYAAELAGWRPTGAAFALSRPMAWVHADDCMGFLLTALEMRADHSLDDIQTWVAQAALGLVRGLSPEQASLNLQVLLGRLLRCSWLRPEHFPVVLSGVRIGVHESDKCPDPIAPVLRILHTSLVKRHGHAAASSLVLWMCRFASDADRQLVAQIILTS